MDLKEKNRILSERASNTRQRHKEMSCITRTFKIDYSHLRLDQRESLKMMFVEAKWVYNSILASLKDGKKLSEINYKDYNKVSHYTKDKELIETEVKYLAASVKQEIIAQFGNQLKAIKSLNKNGHKTGQLKFISDFNSLSFKQYGMTHRIEGSNKIKIQGIRRPIRVGGLNQLECLEEAEYTTLKLLKRADEYFISLTVFSKPERKASRPLNKPVGPERKASRPLNKPVGIDMGIKDHLTLSDGRTFNVMVGESERLKRLQKKLSRQKKGSNNHYRTRIQIQREYMKMDWKKNDLANKICNDLLSNYSHVYFQDENLNGWKVRYGKTVQHSVLGRVKSTLKRHKDQCTMLSRYLPTTKLCPECGSLNESITLHDRAFKCPHCGYFHPSRDVHAACNMIKIGQGLTESKACGDFTYIKSKKQEAVGSSAQR